MTSALLAALALLLAVACDTEGHGSPGESPTGGSEAPTGRESQAPTGSWSESAGEGAADEPGRRGGSASGVLVDLRERLERARASDADEPVTTGPASVEGLVGTHRGVIENALGAPSECEMGTQTVCPGGGGPCVDEERAVPAPCEGPDDVFYSFYHLPEGWVGGGPELLLRYDAAGRCTHAVWRFTE